MPLLSIVPKPGVPDGTAHSTNPFALICDNVGPAEF